MVKVVFAGPSLHGCSIAHPTIEFRPPAAQGDLQVAVLEGANVIGLVDGFFETVAATWHKEILFALSQGVAVFGAASMGALRAAECQVFGMVPIGTIAARFASGTLDDDAAVAQLHGPAELGYLPLTEALVDCEALLDALRSTGCLDQAETSALRSSARATFFKERTWRVVLEKGGLSQARSREVLALITRRRWSLKRQDALLLMEAVAACPNKRSSAPDSWRLAQTPAWLRTLQTRA